MPRYYLHIRDSGGLGKDPDGIEVPDIDAAHAEALRVARDMQVLWSDMPPEARNELAFEIADETGRTVLTVPFSEAEGPLH
jgi:hypothetical protein